jgi:cytochrome c
MKKLLSIITCSAVLGLFNHACAAESHATQGDGMALVQRAILYMVNNGKAKTITEINNPKGQFRDRDIFVTMHDMKGVELANAADPSLVGTNLMEWKDADGKFLFKERFEKLKSREKAWQDYKLLNPKSKKVESRSSYYEKFQDIILSTDINQ